MVRRRAKVTGHRGSQGHPELNRTGFLRRRRPYALGRSGSSLVYEVRSFSAPSAVTERPFPGQSAYAPLKLYHAKYYCQISAWLSQKIVRRQTPVSAAEDVRRSMSWGPRANPPTYFFP